MQSSFIRANYVQIISELKLWQMRLGLLVNFGMQKVQTERIPFTEKAKAIQENYDYVKNFLTESERRILIKLRDAILCVFEAYGIGYGEITYRKFIEAELDYRQIMYENRSPIEVRYEGEVISVFKMKPLLIERQLICQIKALAAKFDFYDVAKIQSYLRAKGLKTGIIVNFGKNDLEICGVRV